MINNPKIKRPAVLIYAMLLLILLLFAMVFLILRRLA